ncbi:MAG: DNA helicase UvrD [Desulfuromonas sp.]|nr:MAG: DNA helicase UvrD [Desulfuromonas sp.]
MTTSVRAGQTPPDSAVRERALDPSRSFIVQAPAGSGKTELLIQRLLVLLAECESPEEVLAITFTRKAASEMRSRLLQALERGCDDVSPNDSHAIKTWELARRVLQRDRKHNWRLIDNPSRLQIQTIDSLCAVLTRRMPWLTRCGDAPRVNDDPIELYREAAEQLLERLQRSEKERHLISPLLARFDNQLPRFRDALVTMLGRRDQWLRHLLKRRRDKARALLEEGLGRFVCSRLEQVTQLLEQGGLSELRQLIDFAVGNLDHGHPLQSLPALLARPAATVEAQVAWNALTDLVLTGKGDVRSTVTKAQGFPAGKQHADMKQRMTSWLEGLRENSALHIALKQLRSLPRSTYHDEDWAALESLIELLPLAAGELELVFSRRGEIDFIGLASAARLALGSADQPEEMLLALDRKIRHLLIDEFQDTSYGQYDLVLRLISGWCAGDGRTLFLVGDPMQSIYRFREAEVGLFIRARAGKVGDVCLDPLSLTANFRSQAGLVSWFNDGFQPMFPPQAEEVSGAVPFSPAEAVCPSLDGVAVSGTAWVGRQDRAEAERIVEHIRHSQCENPGGTIAVLVRSRSHLRDLVTLLQRESLTFQAQDIDPLNSRPVAQDLLALTRALLHPADRVAWLAILRAPWAGLPLSDLVELCEGDISTPVWNLLSRQPSQTELFPRFSKEGMDRLQRIVPVLAGALDKVGRLPLRRLVESTWLQLGGPACLTEGELSDARQFFYLLEREERGGDLESFARLQERLGKLYAAPDPLADGTLQLMTIHKAKGLEFDTVILPGLGRATRGNEREMLRWQEHPDFELLLAPIPAADTDRVDETYNAIGELLKDKDRHESVRLLYVAATRAKQRLYLLGHLEQRSKGEPTPTAGSLLELAWPYWQSDFDVIDDEDGDLDDSSSPVSSLARLPSIWRIPEFAGSLKPDVLTTRKASEKRGTEYRHQGASLRFEEGRIVGQVVHSWLERIALEGVNVWTAARVDANGERIADALLNGGIPSQSLPGAKKKVILSLKVALSSDKGTWILAAHDGAKSELPLTGIINGNRISAVIDRTFVAEDGDRWVIDYKTGEPEQGESLQAFLDREVDRYREQLVNYSQLICQSGMQERLRAALYFMPHDIWQEVRLP